MLIFKRLPHTVIVAMLLFLAVTPAAANAQEPVSASNISTLEKNKTESERKSVKFQAQIDTFYLTRDGNPLWINEQKQLSEQGRALANMLQLSWQNGLNPAQYNNTEIQKILNATDNGTRMDSDMAIHLEVLLTSGYVGYIRDLSGMRINPGELFLRAKDWRQQIAPQDALSYLTENASDIESFLKAQEPQTRTYQALKSELIRLVSDGEINKPHRPKINLAKTLYPGNVSEEVPVLREMFHLLLTPDRISDKYTYDNQIVTAVKNFQMQNGLEPDGIIGEQTRYALNHTNQEKIEQIIVNMERLRWVEDIKPNRFIVVNIPSASLWAIEDGVVVHEMPVVVGRKKRETLSFVTYIHGVRLNPNWTVPPTIKEEDIWPQLKQDATYLNSKGMELFDGYAKDAQTLDPTAIDWHAVTEADLHGLRMVQTPGAHNPLGRVRILMPNEYNIYLHDTPERNLFSRTDRALSSGCIRMKNPEDIARYILKTRNGWNEMDMRKILETGKTTDIYISDRIAVYILYYTIWHGVNGQIVYGRDIYDYDALMVAHMKKLDHFPKFGDN